MACNVGGCSMNGMKSYKRRLKHLGKLMLMIFAYFTKVKASQKVKVFPFVSVLSGLLSGSVWAIILTHIKKYYLKNFNNVQKTK